MLFASPVDYGIEGDQEYLDEQYDYTAEQGKRNPPLDHVYSYGFPLNIFSSKLYCIRFNCPLNRVVLVVALLALIAFNFPVPSISRFALFR